jgi:hypothetical protein
VAGLSSLTIECKEDGTGINSVHGEVTENHATADLEEYAYSKSKKSGSSRFANSEYMAGSRPEDRRRQPNVDQIVLDVPASTSSNHRSLKRPQKKIEKDQYASDELYIRTSPSSDEEGRPKRGRPKRGRPQTPRVKAASINTMANPASTKMIVGASNTPLRLVESEETWGNVHELREGRNALQGNIATNFEMLLSEREVTRGRVIAIGAREEHQSSLRENRYFEEVFVPGEEQPQKRCRSCGWTSSSPRWETRQSQVMLEQLL